MVISERSILHFTPDPRLSPKAAKEGLRFRHWMCADPRILKDPMSAWGTSAGKVDGYVTSTLKGLNSYATLSGFLAWGTTDPRVSPWAVLSDPFGIPIHHLIRSLGLFPVSELHREGKPGCGHWHVCSIAISDTQLITRRDRRMSVARMPVAPASPSPGSRPVLK